MNIQVENEPNCITKLRVELPPERVSEAWDAIARDYTRHARIPGYRPGKAPRNVIEAKFKKEIREELQKKLLSESCREAISEKHLRVISLAEVEELEIAQDNSMRFTAKLVTAPEFELPDYKNIAVKETTPAISDADVDASIDHLRNQFADFTDVPERGLAMEDFAVIDYRGTIDGKPVGEVFPKAGAPLSGNDDFWIRMTPEAFFPGFCEQLAGAKSGDSREFEIAVPADFAVKELADQKIRYAVTVKAVKEKVLPELNDELAEKISPGKKLAEVRDLARHELEHQREHAIDREKKNQIMQFLLSNVNCELPGSMLRYETRRILSEIVRENQERGVADQVLKENEKDLVGAATQGAAERVKGSFILMRIAEAEKIAVTKSELDERISALAERYQLSRDKMLKELEKRDALEQINEEILTGKVLDFLSSSASVQPVSA